LLRMEIARSAAEIENLRTAWERLHAGGGYSLFQSYAWNLLAARVFGAREAPRVVHVESGAGEAIVPACLTADGRLGLLGETLFDYRDALLSGEPEVLRRAWEALAAEGRDFSVTAVAGEAARQQCEALGFAACFFCNAPRVRPGDLDAAQFARAHHHSVDQLRRLKRLGATLRLHSGEERELVAEIYRRKAAQDIAGNLFADPLRVEFGMAAAAMDSGCEVFTLETGTALLAALLTYRDGGVRRLYTTWYDPQWAKYSPGNALLFEVARRSLEQGMECDLMTGEQPHKARFATFRVPLYDVKATAQMLAEMGRGRAIQPIAA